MMAVFAYKTLDTATDGAVLCFDIDNNELPDKTVSYRSLQSGDLPNPSDSKRGRQSSAAY